MKTTVLFNAYNWRGCEGHVEESKNMGLGTGEAKGCGHQDIEGQGEGRPACATSRCFGLSETIKERGELENQMGSMKQDSTDVLGNR